MDAEELDIDVGAGPGRRGTAAEPGPAASHGVPPADPDGGGGEPGQPAPTSTLMALSQAGRVTLGASDIEQLAGELATQLFQQWEVALQEQFQVELGHRLEAELEHRAHEARTLHSEVQERRQRLDNPWRTRHGAWGHATWEMDQALTRQAADLEQTEREIRELRERLRELGHDPDGGTTTVDVATHGTGQ